MKVLRVHNYYGSASPSGENNLFDEERILLEKLGVDTLDFTVRSDDYQVSTILDKIQVATDVIWSNKMKNRFERVIDQYEPDLIHVHNTFPFISPSIFWRDQRTIPIVMTLHNYRLLCPKAIPLRNGKVCNLCIAKKHTLNAIGHACYRGSRLATLPIALNIQLHRILDTWGRVDAFIFLTKFQQKLFLDSGITVKQSIVKPNPNSYTPKASINYRDRNGVCFVGRISEEKGILDIASAWVRMGEQAPLLTIAGDGPQSEQLKKIAVGNPKIKFLGGISQSSARELIRSSRLCILPSRWFEGFPMVLSDAIACQTPALVANVGSLKEIADSIGLPTFELSDQDALIEKVKRTYQNFNLMNTLSEKMQKYYELHLEPNINTMALIELYESLLSHD